MKRIPSRWATCNLLPVIAWLSAAMVAVPAFADRPAAMSSQTIKAPSGPASLKGLGESFEPNLSTGTGNFSVPIQVVPGIVEPSVSLNYTGGTGKGELGMSFSMPVLNIYRTTDKGSPDFDEEDRFAVSGPSLNDELVLVNPQKRWYRMRNEGAFALFVRDAANDTWTIRMPNGDQSHLGEVAEARQTSIGRTYRWYITRYEDRFNHEIKYAYFEDLGKIYLEEIHYQFQAPEDYQNYIIFNYEEREDVFSDYTYGSKVTCAYRMSSIEVFHGPRRMRIYRLEYEDGLLFSMLKSVEMEGENGLKMPKLSFGYIAPSTESGTLVEMTSVPPLEGLADGTATLEDLNGDGLPDILYGRPGDYKYYENIDGYQWGEPVRIAGSPDRGLDQSDTLLTDMDGDGFRDVVHTQDGAFRYYPGGNIKDGVFNGFGEPIALSTNGTPVYHFGSPQVKMNDVNSDGRIDLLYQKAGQDIQVINTKENRLEESFLENDFPLDVDFSDPNLQLMDFNGDGVLDFVLKEINAAVRRVRVWFGLGRGQYGAEQQMLGVPGLGEGEELYLEDVNKDGQTDLLRISASKVSFYLNDGNLNFLQQQGEFDSTPSIDDTQKIFFADMNGNGTNDIIWVTRDFKLVYLDLFSEPNFGLLNRVDNGMGMVTTMTYRSSTEFMVDDKLSGNPWRLPMPNPVPVIEEIRTTDSLDKIGFEPTISTTTFSYRDGYWDTKEREFRGFAKATSTSWGDEFHETGVTETWMHVGRNLETGAEEEVLKGKPWLQLTKDIQGNLYTSVETNWERRWFCQEDMHDVNEVILPTCSLYNNLEEHREDLVAFAVQTAALTGSWEKTNTPRWSATSSKFNEWGAAVRNETWGEVTFAGSHTPGQGFDLSQADVYVGDDETISETDYIYNIERWLLSLPYENRTYDKNENLISASRDYYDGDPFIGLEIGQVTKGLVTRSAAWLKNDEGVRWIDTKRIEYNDNGLLVTTKDANDNVVEMEYDLLTGQFPSVERFFVEIGPLEFRAYYDTGTGATTSITDLNENHSEFRYDGLGRLTDFVDSLSSIDQPTMQYEYDYGSLDNPLSVTRIRSLVDRKLNTYRTSWQYSDGTGNARLTKVQAEKPYEYIASGWVKMSSRGGTTHLYDSFPSNNFEFESAPSNTPVTISYLDGVGRVGKVIPPVADEYGETYTLTRYMPFETIVYDERDTYEQTWMYPSITRTDGQGRTREIINYNDIDDIFTELKWKVNYSTLGSITGISDPQGNVRHYSYDSLNRLQSVVDPNTKKITYQYDDTGVLTRRVDTLGQVQKFRYGPANRLLEVTMQNDVNGRPDYHYLYHYDTPSTVLPLSKNLRGKLSSVEWPTGSYQASYDELGRVVMDSQTLWDGKSDPDFQIRDKFESTYSYNAAGKIVGENTPGGLHLGFQYSDRLLLKDVTGGFGTDNDLIFSNISYDHRGAIRQTDMKNGMRTCSWYDSRARLEGISSGNLMNIDCSAELSTPNPAAIQQITYSRTPKGLIRSVNDISKTVPGIQNFNASYEYDRLYQLKKANTQEGTLSFGYDTIQNLVYQKASSQGELMGTIYTGKYTYGENGAGPNQITGAGDKTFKYDDAGRMKQYNGYDLTFDVENHLVKAEKPGQVSVEYYYNDIGQRKLTIVKKPNVQDKVNRYVSEIYQIKDGNEIWIVSGGQGQVEISKSQGQSMDLRLLDEMNEYALNRDDGKKPLTAEYMDLNNDGNILDAEDIEIAISGYWNNVRVGNESLIYRYYHKDHLGGTTTVTDSIGDIVSTLRYHPYGQIAHQSGESPVHGFAGGEIEEQDELGLTRYGARWYAPAIGRWISPDPLIGQSPQLMLEKLHESNLYSYSTNNPINGKDPTGLVEIEVATFSGGNPALLNATRAMAGKMQEELNRDFGIATTKVDQSRGSNLNLADDKTMAASKAAAEKRMRDAGADSKDMELWNVARNRLLKYVGSSAEIDTSTESDLKPEWPLEAGETGPWLGDITMNPFTWFNKDGKWVAKASSDAAKSRMGPTIMLLHELSHRQGCMSASSVADQCKAGAKNAMNTALDHETATVNDVNAHIRGIPNMAYRLRYPYDPATRRQELSYKHHAEWFEWPDRSQLEKGDMSP